MKSLSAEEKKKRNIIIAIVLVVFAVIFWFVIGTPSSNTTGDIDAPEIIIIDEEETFESSFRNQFGTELIELKENVALIDNQTKTLQERNSQLEAENNQLLADTLLALANLETANANQALRDNYSYPTPPDYENDQYQNPEMNSSMMSVIPPEITVMTGLITVGSPISYQSDDDNINAMLEENKEPDLIIPIASFMRGELLSGVTVPTMGKGTSDPVPAIIRITDIAKLPNFYRADITECFILVESKGSLATEMVSMRLKSLSCKDSNGQTIERNLDGYVAGENGMEGLRGKVISKQGTILGRTFIASFMSGLAEAFGDSTQSIITSPSGTLTTINPEQALESGLWSGAAGATNQLAEFYMDLANEMVPVIEINAGRKVDIIFLKSVNLSTKESK